MQKQETHTCQERGASESGCTPTECLVALNQNLQ